MEQASIPTTTTTKEAHRESDESTTLDANTLTTTTISQILQKLLPGINQSN